MSVIINRENRCVFNLDASLLGMLAGPHGNVAYNELRPTSADQRKAIDEFLGPANRLFNNNFRHCEGNPFIVHSVETIVYSRNPERSLMENPRFFGSQWRFYKNQITDSSMPLTGFDWDTGLRVRIFYAGESQKFPVLCERPNARGLEAKVDLGGKACEPDDVSVIWGGLRYARSFFELSANPA